MSYSNARRVRPLNIRSLGQVPQGTMSDISNIAQIVSSGLSTIITAAQPQQPAATPTYLPATTPALPSDLLAPATPPTPSWVMPVVVTGGLVLVGGIAFMVMRKRAVKANRRGRRVRRNGRRSRRSRRNSGRRRSRASKLTARAAKRLLISRGVPMGRDVHELSFSQLNEVAAVARQAGYRKSKNAPGSTGRMYYQHLSRVRGNGRRSRRSVRRNESGQHAFLYYRGGRGYYRDASGKVKSTKLKPYEEHKGHGHSFYKYLRSTRAKGPSKKSGRFLEMNRLTARQRARIPLKAFVFPERRAWPINSSRRAYAATQMMRLGRVRSASDFNAIRNTIRTRYPKVWNLFGRNVTWDKTKAAKTRARRSRASHRGRRSVGIAANRRRSLYPTRRRRRSSFEKTAAKAIRGMGRRSRR
jgi:hypothetical protein